MRKRRVAITLVALSAVGALALGLWRATEVEAADHNDPPSRTTGASADPAADIGDLYVFVRGESTVFVVTYAGPMDPVGDQAGTYDPDVLYGIHVDTDGDVASAEHDIWVRFAQNASGNWGMQVQNVPGAASSTLAGPVEFQNPVDGDGGTFWAGLRDDPFFFDGQGSADTFSTGDLAFESGRDTFAGKNITAIVIEVPSAAVTTGTDSTFDVWATTARITP